MCIHLHTHTIFLWRNPYYLGITSSISTTIWNSLNNNKYSFSATELKLIWFSLFCLMENYMPMFFHKILVLSISPTLLPLIPPKVGPDHMTISLTSVMNRGWPCNERGYLKAILWYCSVLNIKIVKPRTETLQSEVQLDPSCYRCTLLSKDIHTLGMVAQ